MSIENNRDALWRLSNCETEKYELAQLLAAVTAERDEALAKIKILKRGADATIAQKEKDYRELESLFYESVSETKQANAELAEALARIKASQGQDPVAWCYGLTDEDAYGLTLFKDNPALEPLYAAPVIQPTEAELLAKIERLERDCEALKYSLQLDEDLIGQIQKIISVLNSRPQPEDKV